MSRYIDIDKIVPIAIQAVVDVVGHGISQVDAVRIVEKLDDASTADVVEVVRCKDCKHFSIDEGDCLGICNCQRIARNFGGEIYPEENHFCSDGIRREK